MPTTREQRLCLRAAVRVGIKVAFAAGFDAFVLEKSAERMEAAASHLRAQQHHFCALAGNGS